MKKFVCTICGYVHEGDDAPEKCPQCGAAKGSASPRMSMQKFSKGFALISPVNAVKSACTLR